MRDILKQIVVFILTWEARAMLARYKPQVIAITGSVGKTTTKDAVYAALSGEVHVRKSEKSFNSEFGVPLTILGFETGWGNPLRWLTIILRGLVRIVAPQKYPRWLVLEVGADRPGDIRRIAKWLRPDIVVITGVPEIPVHVEYFNSPLALAREKKALAGYIRSGGKLVLNGDDSRMVEMCAEFRAMTITYGFGNKNSVVASGDEIIYEENKPTGVRFRVDRDGSSLPVAVYGALGNPRVYAALAALVVGGLAGVDEVSVARALALWKPPPGRMRILDGVNGSIVIDDSYNSSPAAALSALDALINVQTKRRIAVLGDMLELGKYSAEAHRNVGKRAAECAKMLITVGFRSRAIGEAALDAGLRDKNVREYDQNEATRAGKELREELKEGDLVLVKGSQSMRMERTVVELMAEPERASELLVRQDEEWKNR